MMHRVENESLLQKSVTAVHAEKAREKVIELQLLYLEVDLKKITLSRKSSGGTLIFSKIFNANLTDATAKTIFCLKKAL